MRVAALLVVLVVVAGIMATMSPRLPGSSSRPPQGSDGPGSNLALPFPPPPALSSRLLQRSDGPGPNLLASPRPLQDSDAPRPTALAQIPTPLPPPARLPATLELVTFPNLPSAARSSAPKTTTRTEALASVIASQEFQDTVTPLARLYFATFGRYPDYEGLNHYTGQREEARPLDAIATEFVGSREFQRLYGLLENAEFVERMFVNILGHPAQADVRNYWVTELDSGRMTRGQVLVDLSESGAFRERIANQVFVSTAYTEALRRTPDPFGFQYWVTQMQRGQPPNAVLNGLLGPTATR